VRTLRRPAPIVAIAVLAACLASLGACSSSGADGTPDQAVDRQWPPPADASAAAKKAGLEMLAREMLQVHYHAHLDVSIDGGAVTVPPNIGIDVQRKAITALHTHDSTGIIHIESAEDIPFTLGQFFIEWGQPLSPSQVGKAAVPQGSELRVYRNGKRVEGDPNKLKLNAHDEIVVWVGPAGEQPKVPSSYNFPNNL
jgi:hypothetical protein